MPKLENLDDLNRIRDQARKGLKVRLETDTTITVGMGACGVAAGARDTMHAILDELQKRGIEGRVTIADCIARCASEPLVTIERAGTGRVTYASIKADMVPRLVEEHLVNGRVVEEWVLGDS